MDRPTASGRRKCVERRIVSFLALRSGLRFLVIHHMSVRGIADGVDLA